MDPTPSLEDGLQYWETQEASLDGVLGGWGNGPLPRVDALSSRQFLLSLMPDLCLVPSALRKLQQPAPQTRKRALDVGAGIGRVTASVLLHLVSDVVLVEPVPPLIQKAVQDSSTWKGISDSSKSVTFIQTTLQNLDPSQLPPKEDSKQFISRVGYETRTEAGDGDGDGKGFDIIWCQWCLGHLANEDLVKFFQRCQKALRPGGIIVVKENCCPDSSIGGPFTSFDPDDSSLTRSDKAWLEMFSLAGLRVLKDEVQQGFPPELFTVKSYAVV